MSDANDTFSEQELRRIAAFHLWEAAKRIASVASRATDPVLRAELEESTDALRRAHQRLSSDRPREGDR